MNWHLLTIPEIFELLGTNINGLSSIDAEEKLMENGRNVLVTDINKTKFILLLSQFREVMVLLLITAAIIAGCIGEIMETIVILMIVVLNALLGFYQEYSANKAMKGLREMGIANTRVLRNASTQWLPATEIVAGDIVLLEAGNAIPADIRIIESVYLKMDEAALTGESESIEKGSEPINVAELSIGDKKNMAFKGTFVAHGRGMGVVVATGMQTELGRIAKLLQQPEPKTPLQIRLAAFGKKMAAFSLLICIVFFITGLIRGEGILKLVLTSISLAVAAIPEALPAVIAISLAFAAKRLSHHKTLIKKLSAVEALGSITYICTDKTGTLTKNKMHVAAVFFEGKQVDPLNLSNKLNDPAFQLLMQAFALNNDSIISTNQIVKGDSTEVALMEFVLAQNKTIQNWPRLSELPFDATRKMMTTFHLHEHKIISFSKGAPDILINHCLNVDRVVLKNQIDDMAAKGYRVLGFAYKSWEVLPTLLNSQVHESGLTFLGLVGIVDPPRENVVEAIQQCKLAGIVPVMITGDYAITANYIAKKIGIITNEQDLSITGKELAEMDKEVFLAMIERIKVYARVSPEQKLQIVKTLQLKGHSVAMTGDGINDAPSLKGANIGIAMCAKATDVAKESAHIILLDDQFATILIAIREGRRIYDNILKVIKYLITTNAGELWTILLGPMIGLPIALLPIHLLWINLVSDGLPAISLTFEQAEKDIMTRPPPPPQQSIFASGRGFHMLWVGLFMAGITLSVQGFCINKGLHWQTIVFNVLCFSQMGHLLAIRSNKVSIFTIGFFSNKLLISAVLLSFILQFSITYIPFFNPIFKTEALTFKEAILVIMTSSMVFIAVEIEKQMTRKIYDEFS